MAGSGIKGTTQLTAGSLTNYTLLYSVPTGYYGVYNISFTNTTNATVTIRMYIGASTTGSPVPSEAYEYQTSIVAYGVFERTGVVAGPGANFVVSSGGSATNVNIYGIETSTS